MDTHALLATLDALVKLPDVRIEQDAVHPGNVLLRSLARHRELLLELNKHPEIRGLLNLINTDPIFLTVDQADAIPREAAEKFLAKYERTLSTLGIIRDLLRNTVQEHGGLLVRLPPMSTLGELDETISALHEIFDYPLKTVNAEQVRFQGAEAGSTILVLTLAGKAIGIVSSILYLFFWFTEKVIRLKHAAIELESHAELKQAAVDLVKTGCKGLEKDVEREVDALLRNEAPEMGAETRNEAVLRIARANREKFNSLIDKGMEISLSADASEPLKRAFPQTISLRALKQKAPQLGSAASSPVASLNEGENAPPQSAPQE